MTMLPHPTLTEHYGTAEEKPEFVNRLFDRAARHYDAVVGWGFLQSGASYRRWALKEHGLRPPHHLLDVACGTGLVAVEAATDRKSTRLNSSHLGISYAVFCLKKK